MKHIIQRKNGRVSIALLTVVFMLAILTGCGRSGGVAAGQRDNVDGFLFIFDNRKTTQQLVEAMEKEEIPKQVELQYLDDSKIVKDPDSIRSIYHALSNVIVVGEASPQSQPKDYYVIFTLADGIACRFDFENRSYIRIGDQSYVVESGMELWDLLEDM